MKKARRGSIKADNHDSANGLEASHFAVNSFDGRVLKDFSPMERSLVPMSEFTQV